MEIYGGDSTLNLVMPKEEHKEDVLSFYSEFENNDETCIGYGNYKNYGVWLTGMNNRREGKNLPDGWVRENFYLCYDENDMVGVFSLKFELTDFLMNYGDHIGYAVRPSKRNCGLATQILKQGLELSKGFCFDRILCVCDDDNYTSEKVILRNGGRFENVLFDSYENVFVKRFWIDL